MESKMRDEKDVRKTIKKYNELYELIANYFYKQYGMDVTWQKQLKTPLVGSIHINEIEWPNEDKNYILINAEHWWQDGGSENAQFKMPLSYLWRDRGDVLKDIKHKANKNMEMAKEKEEELSQKKKELIEQKEKEFLQKLLEKYPKL